ncbi:protein kinase [Streptomyces sp. S1D4-11]
MPTQPRITLEPGEELAYYRIESYIARGGMAVVYLARDLSLGRRVALKLLAPELTAHTTFRARFIRESELAASVDHPNILPIYQAGEADNVLYIAMRYVDGEDLAALLQSRANTPEGHGQLTLSEAMPCSPRSRARWTPPTTSGWYTGTSNPATSFSPTPPCRSHSATPTSPTSD